MIHKETTYEWRVAYISDGSTEEIPDGTEENARFWVDFINMGGVEDIAIGDAFLQRRKVITLRDSQWESVLD